MSFLGSTSFLRVSDLLLISVVINHDVGSLLLHKNIMFSFRIIDKFLLEKCFCSSSNNLTSWYPAYRLKHDVKPLSLHIGHIMPKYG